MGRKISFVSVEDAPAPQGVMPNAFTLDYMDDVEVNGAANDQMLVYNAATSLWINKTLWQSNANNLYYNGGNVGIGTNTPVSRLDVEGGVSIGATYSGTTAAPANGLIVEGNVGVGTNAPQAQLHLYSTSDNRLRIESGTGNAQINIKSSANMYPHILFTQGNTNQFEIGKVASDGNFYFNNNPQVGEANASMVISNTGDVGIGTTAPAAKLSIVGTAHISRDSAAECCSGANYTLSLAESTSTTGKTAKIQFHNAGLQEGYIELAPNGPRRFRLKDNQNVGMGLEMDGTISFTGGGGPMCVFMAGCPRGWVDRGSGGFLYNACEAACPYGAGGGYAGCWQWCHPRICCNQ